MPACTRRHSVLPVGACRPHLASTSSASTALTRQHSSSCVQAMAAAAPVRPPRRIGLIECEDAAKWEGYTETLWRRALEEPGDVWTLYKACQGQLPSVEEAQLDAIIIGGSHYSVYESHDWIKRLLGLLRALALRGTRMYGCCFGCQALAVALGGSVGANPDGRFVLTIEQVTPTPQLQQFERLHGVVAAALATASSSISGSSAAAADAAADGLAAMQLTEQQPGGSADSPSALAAAAAASMQAAVASAADTSNASCSSCFRVIESHGDQVLSLPPGATCLAASPTACNELWCWGSNVLASQFHLEFDEPLVIDKIWSALAGSRLDEEQAAASRCCLEAGGAQNGALLQVIRHFMAHGIGAPASAAAAGCDGAEQLQPPAPPPAPPADGDDSAGGGSGTGASSGGPGAASQQQQQQPEQRQEQEGQPEQQQAPEQPGAAPASAVAAAASWLPGLPLLWTSSGGGGHAPPGGAVSGCSSPTAASEVSVATAASTASTVPFAAIARQRKAAVREEELGDASRRLVADAAAAFEARMAAYVGELSTLQRMNAAAAAQYGATAEVAAALGQFAADLAARQAGVREALAALPALDRQLKLLEASVGLLDKRSKVLEERVCGGGRGSGMGSSAYAYLASFSRVGSGASAGGGGCLGGGPAPKQ